MTDPTTPQRHRQEPGALWGHGFGLVATRSLQLLIVLSLSILIVIASIALKTEVIAVLLAIIFACAFAPVARLLRTKARFPHTLASLVTVLLALGTLGGILTLVGFAVAGQYKSLSQAASASIEQVLNFLKTSGLPIANNLNEQLLKEAQKYTQNGEASKYALEGISTIGEVATGAVLMVIVLFFLLRDGAKIWEFLCAPLKGSLAGRAERIGFAASRVLGAYSRGTALVALTDAVLIGTALAIMHVPLALPLATIIFISAFIPILGATVAGALATAVALVSQGPIVAIVVLGIVVLINQLESHLLHPFITGRAVSLHPLVVLLALVAGTILGGIIGAILAVPFASVVWASIKAWREPEVELESKIEAETETSAV